MKKKFKKYCPTFLFALLVMFYFEYSVTILWDSAHYMNYVNILEGVQSWNTWDVVRGPVFPIIIFTINLLFGKSTQGLLMGTFVQYLVMLIFIYHICEYFGAMLGLNKKEKNIIEVIILVIIIFNPIIYGFYHSLLTEFVAITLSVVSSFFAIMWLRLNYFEDKKKYLIVSVLFVLLTVFSWFLKQPYVSCGFFALIVAYIISFFEERDIKLALIRTGTVFCCVIVLFVSINMWNKFLVWTGNDPTTDRNPTNSLGNQLLVGVSMFEVNNNTDILNKKDLSNFKFSKEEKKSIYNMIDEEKDYVIVNIYKNKKIIDSDYLISSNGSISTIDSLIYIIKVFFKYPIELMDSYIANYLSISDIYSTKTSDGVGYTSTKKFDLKFSSEISVIGYRAYYQVDNIFPMLPEMQERVECYNQPNVVFSGINIVMRALGWIALIFFKILFLLLPFNLIGIIIKRIKCNKTTNLSRVYDLIIILLGFSFLHVLLHTVTGAILDRYAVPVLIPTFLGTTFIVYINLVQKRKNKYLFNDKLGEK